MQLSNRKLTIVAAVMLANSDHAIPLRLCSQRRHTGRRYYVDFAQYVDCAPADTLHFKTEL